MVKVIQMLVDESKWDKKCPYEMENPEFVTIHNTANDTSAQNEVDYMTNNNNEVSFHFAVDDIQAIQAIPTNRNAWHCGDGGNGTGNRKSIGIEICYSECGGDKYYKAENNAAELTAMLLKEHGLGIDKVKQHNHWSGKNCPHRIRAEGTWNEFIAKVESHLGTASAPPSQPTTPPPTQPSSEVAPIPTLKKGSKGGEVKKLQSILGGLTVDGDFGSKTESVLESWQKTNGLTADGIYGSKSQAKMQTQLDGGSTPSEAPSKIKYRVYTKEKGWLSWIEGYNTTDGMGYAGVKGQKILGVQIQGSVEYQVHITSGKWYSWIKGYNTTDSMGYAGDLKNPIDAIRIKNKTYRVAPCDAESNDYYSWITHYNTSNDMGYAGVYGKAIDQLQIQ